MKRFILLSLSICSFALFQSCQNGGKSNQQKADSINASKQSMNEDASQFMTQAAVINLTEISLGTVAQNKASSNRVQKYAAMIVSDHKKLQQKLQKIAQTNQVVLPDSLDKAHHSDVSALKNEKGEKLDMTFINDMSQGHQKAIKAFKEAAKKVTNKELKKYIQNALPGLKTHLDSAQTIMKSLHLDTHDKSAPTMPIPKS